MRSSLDVNNDSKRWRDEQLQLLQGHDDQAKLTSCLHVDVHATFKIQMALHHKTHFVWGHPHLKLCHSTSFPHASPPVWSKSSSPSPSTCSLLCYEFVIPMHVNTPQHKIYKPNNLTQRSEGNQCLYSTMIVKPLANIWHKTVTNYNKRFRIKHTSVGCILIRTVVFGYFQKRLTYLKNQSVIG